MLKAIRRRMTYANVVATLALMFAMTGGAFAAGKYLITSTKQIKPSVVASLKGVKGKNGKDGAAGPQGPAGPGGAAGPKGENGTSGQAGKDGVSVTSSESAGTIEATHCVGVGGSKLESVSGKSYVCNGKEGKEGKEGSPWVGGGTLPSEETETGTWGTGPAGAEGGQGFKFFPISFTIPLKKAPQQVFVPSNKESEPGCPGRGGGSFSTTGQYKPTVPMAEPGMLCVYAEGWEEAEFVGVKTSIYENEEWFMDPGTAASGAMLDVHCLSNFCIAMGTWAVSAE